MRPLGRHREVHHDQPVVAVIGKVGAVAVGVLNPVHLTVGGIGHGPLNLGVGIAHIATLANLAAKGEAAVVTTSIATGYCGYDRGYFKDIRGEHSVDLCVSA